VKAGKMVALICKEKDGGLKWKEQSCMDALNQVMGYSGLKPG